MFPIMNGLKEDALLSLFFNFALEYANHKLLTFNGTHTGVIPPKQRYKVKLSLYKP